MTYELVEEPKLTVDRKRIEKILKMRESWTKTEQLEIVAYIDLLVQERDDLIELRETFENVARRHASMETAPSSNGAQDSRGLLYQTPELAAPYDEAVVKAEPADLITRAEEALAGAPTPDFSLNGHTTNGHHEDEKLAVPPSGLVARLTLEVGDVTVKMRRFGVTSEAAALNALEAVQRLFRSRVD